MDDTVHSIIQHSRASLILQIVLRFLRPHLITE